VDRAAIKPSKILILLLLFFGGNFFGQIKCEIKKPQHEEKLEFPENANTVVILGQSSHLDISWVYTSEEYYEKLVKDIFLNSIDFVKSHKNHRTFFAETFWIDKFLKKEEKEGNELLSLIKDGK